MDQEGLGLTGLSRGTKGLSSIRVRLDSTISSLDYAVEANFPMLGSPMDTLDRVVKLTN